MERNVGRLDRLIRILGGIVIVLAVLSPFAGFLPIRRLETLRLVSIPALLLVIAILLLLTGATGQSVVYRVFGFRTYEPPEEGGPGAEQEAGEASPGQGETGSRQGEGDVGAGEEDVR